MLHPCETFVAGSSGSSFTEDRVVAVVVVVDVVVAALEEAEVEDVEVDDELMAVAEAVVAVVLTSSSAEALDSLSFSFALSFCVLSLGSVPPRLPEELRRDVGLFCVP